MNGFLFDWGGVGPIFLNVRTVLVSIRTCVPNLGAIRRFEKSDFQVYK